MKTDPLLLFFFIISKNLESAEGFKETLKTRTLIVEKKTNSCFLSPLLFSEPTSQVQQVKSGEKNKAAVDRS